MHDSKLHETNLICPICKNVTRIQRRKSKQKKFGHTKDLWCFKCQTRTKHLEIKDLGGLNYKLKNNFELNTDEKNLLTALGYTSENYDTAQATIDSQENAKVMKLNK